ncbi:MAG: sugar ABC transporter ATP-binding protein [Pirellulales bacterium]
MELEFTDIRKSFFGAPVLKGVSFRVPSGCVVGLVGENGAGKSTLMNILGGNLAPDSGSMLLDGQLYRPRSPRSAADAGIAFIHQELNLFPNLSVAENIFLTRFPTSLGHINRSACHRMADSLLRQVGLSVHPATRTEHLSAGERQLLEIAKAISVEARLLILDEPTTSLSRRETDRLFELLRSLKSRGMTMIFISHALHDVRSICEQIVVMRDGITAGQGPTSEFRHDELIRLMVGREHTQQFPPKTNRVQDQVLLSASGLCRPGVLHQVSLDLHAGEVLGIAGLMGSGRTELARTLMGLDPGRPGTVTLERVPITNRSVRDRIRLGMAMVTENRRDDGLCMSLSVVDNAGLIAADRHAHGWFRRLDRSSIERSLETWRQSVRLTTAARADAPVRVLSGGNQQKIVFAKWMLNQPKVLILDEPTRGVDVGAKYDIYVLINQLASNGSGVILISSEIEELMGLSDRLLIMSGGEIRGKFDRHEFDQHQILRACLDAASGSETSP